MVILGIIDSKPSTAAVMIDGRVVSAIAEERLCRMKMANGTPRQAIARVIEESGITHKDIELVAIAQHTLEFFAEPTPWDGWFQNGSNPKKRLYYQLSSGLAPVIGSTSIAWRAHHAFKRLISLERTRKLPKLIREEYAIHAPVRFFDHHYCHATSAYYTSNFDRALVITLDGGGDGRSGSVYLGQDGRLTRLSSVDSFNSLGNFYSYITVLCGFKAENHEGKITGLAAVGEPIYADVLRKFIRYEEPGQIRYTIPMYYRSALERITEELPENFDPAALAASVQLVLEEIATEFVRYWLRRTGMRQIAVAGGVFSNVKLNQRIHELEEVDSFFVHPAMDDGGLAVGAAFAAFAEQPGFDARKMIQRLTAVYFGPEYNESEIEQAVNASGLPAYYESNVHKKIALLLAQGNVVARFTGRMEYGPRALGHRSILYQTTDHSINDWLNERLKRTEFMPFAPATLAEYAHRCYENLAGAEDPARFMTITFNCTPVMRSQSPGVVHVDGTARPQIIDPDSAPDFSQILNEYHQLTGIPSLINTSFNMHGEPIVCSPQDAVRSFKEGNLDYLVIGNWVIENPEAIRSRGDGNQHTSYGA